MAVTDYSHRYTVNCLLCAQNVFCAFMFYCHKVFLLFQLCNDSQKLVTLGEDHFNHKLTFRTVTAL
jgi:hypothetical protein